MSILILFLFITLFIYCFLILRYRSNWNSLKNKYLSNTNNYFISVILPIRNEADTIIDTLNLLKNQTYSKDKFEIIVVDDQSSDNSIDLVKEFISTQKLINISVIEIHSASEKFGKKEAIAKGISNSKGDIIVTTDSDCSFQKNWIAAMVAPIENAGINMVLGKVEIEPEGNSFSKFQHIEFSTLMGLTGATAYQGKPVLANGANLAFRKSAYNEVEKFNVELEGYSGDDVFLMQKINDKNPGSVYFNINAEATVITKGKKTWVELIEQRARWISKIGKYKSKAVSLLGVIIFLVSLSLLFLFLNALVFFNLFHFLLFLLIKSTVDFIFIRAITKYYSSFHLFMNVLMFELLYAFYLIRIITFNKNKIKWKGRKI